MSRRRAVITGVAGFIGSHLADALLERGYSVSDRTNLLTGDISKSAHLRNATSSSSSTRHELHLHPRPVDVVLHGRAASPSRLPGAAYDSEVAPRHAQALGLAKAKGPASFCLDSEVYGDPLEHQKELLEEVNPIGPRGVYDEAKRFAEAIAFAYHRYHGLDVKIARIFNTYGPRMRVNDGRAVPTFISQALRNEDGTIFGDGRQTRSFCYISDLVEGIIRLLDSDVNEPVNLGNPHEMTIEEIARKIISMTGSSSRLVNRELPTDDPKVRQPDITKARALLDWEPKVRLEEASRRRSSISGRSWRSPSARVILRPLMIRLVKM